MFFLSVAVQRFAACLVSFSRDTCVQAGVDSAWEQEKLEAKKMLLNRAESPTVDARFVRDCMKSIFKSASTATFLPKRHKNLAKLFDLIARSRQKLTKTDFSYTLLGAGFAWINYFSNKPIAT